MAQIGMRKLTLLLVIFALTFVGVNCGDDDKGESPFPDPVLADAVRTTLKKPKGDITESNLEGLTALRWSKHEEYSGPRIGDLTGLEYCTNLTEINLTSCGFSDLTPLSSLTSLTHLSLNENRISDISPLSNLTNLKTLDLSLNSISDI